MGPASRSIIPWLALACLASPSSPILCHAERPAGHRIADLKTLTSVAAVQALSSTQAGERRAVQLQATVTYVRPAENALFVMADGLGLYVRFSPNLGLQPGDRVEITGESVASFKPYVLANSVRFLAHGSLPKPIKANYEDLIKSRLDCQVVQIDGRVISASLDDTPGRASLRLRIQVPEGIVEGLVLDPGNLRPEYLMDSEIRITGVAVGEFDGKFQMSGVMVDINSFTGLNILKRTSSDIWSGSLVPLDGVVAAMRYENRSKRVRIAGTLTYFEPGTLAVIQHLGRSMMVKTDSTIKVRTGAGVEVTGYPIVIGESVGLEDAQLRPMPQEVQVMPKPVLWEDASIGADTYDLVSMEGVVVGMVHDSRVDLFMILSNGHLFSATLRHSYPGFNEHDTNQIEPSIGSRVKVTGVCFIDAGNHWRDRLWFDVRMRSMKDLVVLQQPSWWTVKHMSYVVMGLSVLILVAVLWGAGLDRRMRKHAAQDAIRERRLALHEQQRSHILELISSSAPLPEVLREVGALVSSRLNGVRCQFEFHSKSAGIEKVARPSGPSAFFEELFSPSGDSLGFLQATPTGHTMADDGATAALAAGARLAELAIDTRRLYSDLRHRSEFDMLTDIPNRFSMERRLDQLMQSARTTEAVFGLICVDLDCFKQVNDIYGHPIGDLYLIEVARRMKLQLRDGDVLARIGGDEFIALVPILRGRADAEEIAERLERCFDGKFELEGYTLRGSASVGLAIYPEDGISKEELQRAADVAMYAHKETKRRQERMVDAMQHTECEHPALPVES